MTRGGREMNEFLMQRCFLSIVSGLTVPLFKEPRLMTSKSHLVSYNGMVELWPGARMDGAKDVVFSGH